MSWQPTSKERLVLHLRDAHEEPIQLPSDSSKAELSVLHGTLHGEKSKTRRSR